MIIKIERKNWHIDLAAKIESSKDGDTIICHSDAMAELAKSAKARMCPEKNVIFEAITQ